MVARMFDPWTVWGVQATPSANRPAGATPAVTDVFRLRSDLVDLYGKYVQSFVTIRDQRVRQLVDDAIRAERFWPAPWVQLNPAFARGADVDELVAVGTLQKDTAQLFRTPSGAPFTLYQHQLDAVEAARARKHYVVTTGTGSGKSLTYILPIVDHVLRAKAVDQVKRIRAVIVYPMNALANSQVEELKKFLGSDSEKVTFARYTGQESAVFGVDVDVIHPVVHPAYLAVERDNTSRRVAWIGRPVRSKGLPFLVEHAARR